MSPTAEAIFTLTVPKPTIIQLANKKEHKGIVSSLTILPVTEPDFLIRGSILVPYDLAIEMNGQFNFRLRTLDYKVEIYNCSGKVVADTFYLNRVKTTNIFFNSLGHKLKSDQPASLPLERNSGPDIGEVVLNEQNQVMLYNGYHWIPMPSISPDAVENINSLSEIMKSATFRLIPTNKTKHYQSPTLRRARKVSVIQERKRRKK